MITSQLPPLFEAANRVSAACQGKSFMVRYADDFVMGFERLEDVEKVQRASRSGSPVSGWKSTLGRRGWRARWGQSSHRNISGFLRSGN